MKKQLETSAASRSVQTRGTQPGRTRQLAQAILNLSRLFRRGGVIYLPPQTYLRNLQHLYMQGNARSFTNFLNPAIGQLASMTDAEVTPFFLQLLAYTQGGRSLTGIESLFLSGLHAVQLTGNRNLLTAGAAVWRRHRPLPKPGHLLEFYARDSRILTILPPECLPALQLYVTASNLRTNLVSSLVWNQPQFGAVLHIPGGEADDCKDKAAAWAAVGGLVVTGIAEGIWAGATGRTQRDQAFGDTASWLQLGGGVAAAIGLGIAAWGCKDKPEKPDAPPPPTLDDITAALMTVDQLLNLVPSQPGDPPPPEGYTPEHWQAVQSEIQAWIDWITSPGNEPPPGSPEGSMPNPPGPEPEPPGPEPEPEPPGPEPEPEPPGPPDPEGTPVPDGNDSGGWPPGIHKPFAGLPTPDNGGPVGPYALPNGAFFISTSALTAAAPRGALGVRARAVTLAGTRAGTSFSLFGPGISSGFRAG